MEILIQHLCIIEFINLKLSVMNKSKILLGLLAGVAVSAAVAAIVSPSKTKKFLKKSDHLADDIKDSVDDLLGNISDRIGSVVDRANKLVHKGNAKLESSRNIVRKTVSE